MRKIELTSYEKINLILDVFGKRLDGYIDYGININIKKK